MAASTRRVLFVESDESLRVLVQRVLTLHGVTVELAARAPEAIHRLATEKYPMVVIDLVADDGAAYDVVRALAMIPPATRPIVIATGDPSGDPRLDAEVISLVVRKPYDVQALAEIISASMGVALGGGADTRDAGLRL